MATVGLPQRNINNIEVTSEIWQMEGGYFPFYAREKLVYQGIALGPLKVSHIKVGEDFLGNFHFTHVNHVCIRLVNDDEPLQL